MLHTKKVKWGRRSSVARQRQYMLSIQLRSGASNLLEVASQISRTQSEGRPLATPIKIWIKLLLYHKKQHKFSLDLLYKCYFNIDIKIVGLKQYLDFFSCNVCFLPIDVCKSFHCCCFVFGVFLNPTLLYYVLYRRLERYFGKKI